MNNDRLASALALGLSACAPTFVEPTGEDRIEVRQPADSVRFAVIGDYGRAGDGQASVSSLVASWQPDLVLTVGDNNYPTGAAATLDENIGQYYHAFIAPYRGEYGDGADINRFFPTLGNHDWMSRNPTPYLEYFSLPGNERYYDLIWGPVHFFALDSDEREPDGVEVDGVQARWLREALARSQSPWNVVYMHHPPYSSGRHGSETSLRWPFHAWGADLVISGHDHHYERIERSEGTYLVNGLGGYKIYPIPRSVAGSKVRFNDRFGALRGEASQTTLTMEFIDITGAVVDAFTLRRSPSDAPERPRAQFDRYED